MLVWRKDMLLLSEDERGHMRRARVFISYVRSDSTFAAEIAKALKFSGFEVLIDEESIERGEDWREKLQKLIVSADLLVFLLSPRFLKSEVCAWELDRAIAHAKRLVPVLLEETDNAPSSLSSLNYVRFDGGRSFMTGVIELNQTLRADLAWIYEHTRLQQRALEWLAVSCAENRLLIGNDVRAAELWLEQWNGDLPVVTDVQRDFLAASRAVQDRRESEERRQVEAIKKAQRRTAYALSAIGASVTVGLGLGVIQARENANAEIRNLSVYTGMSLRENKIDSALRVSVGGVEANQDFWKPKPIALEHSLRVAAAIDPHIASGDEESLAGSLPQILTEREISERDGSSLRALLQQDGMVGRRFFGGGAVKVTASNGVFAQVKAPGQPILVYSGGPKGGAPKQIAELTANTAPLTALSFSPNGAVLATGAEDMQVVLWSAETGQELGRLTARADRIAFDSSGRFMRTWRRSDETFSLYDLHNLISVSRANESISEAYIGIDGEGVLVRRVLNERFRLFAFEHGVLGDEVTAAANIVSGLGFDSRRDLGLNQRWPFAQEIPPACEDAEPIIPRSPLVKSLTAKARDWGGLKDGSLYVVIADRDGQTMIYDQNANPLAHIPEFGDPMLDAKFDCSGQYLFTVDGAGRFLKWSLKPLINLSASEIGKYACDAHMIGASQLNDDEKTLLRRNPCDGL